MASSPTFSDASTLINETVYNTRRKSQQHLVDDPVAALREQRKQADEYQKEGHFHEAGELYRSVERACARLRGETDLLTLVSKEDLAINSSYRGEYEHAEPVFRLVLSERRRQLDEVYLESFDSFDSTDIRSNDRKRDYLDIARAYYNLAKALCDQNRYREAEPLFVKALRIREKILGHKSVDWLCALCGLATVSVKAGRLEEASGYLKRAQTGYNRLAAQWSSTKKPRPHSREELHTLRIGVLQSLAITSDLQGNHEHAGQLFWSVWDQLSDRKAPNHPEVLEIAYNLATYLGREGDRPRAERFYWHALRRIDVLGLAHPLTQRTIKAFASFLYNQGRTEEADRLCTRYQAEKK